MELILHTPAEDYELLDSGEGEKLERFGSYILRRPDPQAIWRKKLDSKTWEHVHAVFTRSAESAAWRYVGGEATVVTKEWPIKFGGLDLLIKPTAFKHTGLFPEQILNWQWMDKVLAKISEQKSASKQESKPEILNLFAYTGGATLVCARAHASVVHIDSSASAVEWARQNAELCGLDKSPIRWIVEDARVFVDREIKRGRKYDAIIMDPPAFGHGPTKDLWKIEEHFLSLVEKCLSLLSDKPAFFLVNGYSAGYSAIAYKNIIQVLQDKHGGNIEYGELGIQESKIKTDDIARTLPAGIYARWSA